MSSRVYLARYPATWPTTYICTLPGLSRWVKIFWNISVTFLTVKTFQILDSARYILCRFWVSILTANWQPGLEVQPTCVNHRNWQSGFADPLIYNHCGIDDHLTALYWRSDDRLHHVQQTLSWLSGMDVSWSHSPPCSDPRCWLQGWMISWSHFLNSDPRCWPHGWTISWSHSPPCSDPRCWLQGWTISWSHSPPCSDPRCWLRVVRLADLIHYIQIQGAGGRAGRSADSLPHLELFLTTGSTLCMELLQVYRKQ